MNQTHRVRNGVSGENKELLEKLLQHEQSNNQERDCKSGKVSKGLCEALNDMYEDGVSPYTMVEELHISSKSTVYYHLNGKCNHEKRRSLTYDECGWMRVQATCGATTEELCEKYDVSGNTVRRHVTGDCTHEDGIEPVEGSVLRSNSIVKLNSKNGTDSD